MSVSSVWESFLAIFDLVPETCKIVNVKLLSTDKNESKEKTYNFTAQLEAPTNFPDVEMTKGAFNELKSRLLDERDDVGGPDITNDIAWDVTNSEKTKKKKKKFVFTTHLIPENVHNFKIENGVYHITVDCAGIFY